MSQVFHRIQFWRIRRQGNQRNILGNLQIITGVEASLIPDQHHMNVFRNLGGTLLQKEVNDLNIDIRREHPDGMAGFWAGGSDYIQPIVLRLSQGGEPSAPSRPTPRYCALLAKPGFILKVGFDSFVGVSGNDFFQCFWEVFLNASWASGSEFSCRGRGH